jgi:hypothetical protein
MNNKIVLRSVFGKVNNTYYIQPCPNPKTGKLPSCVKTVDSHGDMLLSEEDIKLMSEGKKHFIPADSVLEIVDGTTFDLDDVVDKAKWESIEFCSWIAKDRFMRDKNGDLLIDGNAIRYGKADLYVDRPGEAAKARVTKKKLVHRACAYVYDDSESNRIKKARVLGRDLRNAIPADILDFLIETAEKDPKKVIELYEDEDWKLRLFIITAVERGVIRTVDGIYKYEDKFLGASESAVVEFLKNVQYAKLIASIRKETFPELLPTNELEQVKKNLHKTTTKTK